MASTATETTEQPIDYLQRSLELQDALEAFGVWLADFMASLDEEG